MSIDEPQFTYAQESKQPESPTMIVCNHCGHIARDGFAMDVHWNTYQHHKSHGAHPLGSDPKDMDRLRDQQRDLLKKMGLTVAGEHAAAQAAIISEANAHQWEHKTAGAQAYWDSHRKGQAQARTFTREEVLTVLRATKAVIAVPRGEADTANLRLLSDLIGIFERLE